MQVLAWSTRALPRPCHPSDLQDLEEAPCWHGLIDVRVAQKLKDFLRGQSNRDVTYVDVFMIWMTCVRSCEVTRIPARQDLEVDNMSRHPQ